jgi:hypothetical protein
MITGWLTRHAERVRKTRTGLKISYCKRPQTVWEEGKEENISTYKGGKNRRLENFIIWSCDL